MRVRICSLSGREGVYRHLLEFCQHSWAIEFICMKAFHVRISLNSRIHSHIHVILLHCYWLWLWVWVPMSALWLNSKPLYTVSYMTQKDGSNLVALLWKTISMLVVYCYNFLKCFTHEYKASSEHTLIQSHLSGTYDSSTVVKLNKILSLCWKCTLN